MNYKKFKFLFLIGISKSQENNNIINESNINKKNTINILIG